ncbi:hypothetical protein J3F84DRAFT_130671 [Trichoderma pleuroticola]
MLHCVCTSCVSVLCAQDKSIVLEGDATSFFFCSPEECEMYLCMLFFMGSMSIKVATTCIVSITYHQLDTLDISAMGFLGDMVTLLCGDAVNFVISHTGSEKWCH